jgi:hypothetical protein
MKVKLMKLLNGLLVPLDDSEAQKLHKFKVGSIINAEIAEMRNGKFFAKWWVMVGYAFTLFEGTLKPMEYRGMVVKPELERFRKDITIMAGYCRPVFNAKGEMRLEAESLQWSKMDEDRFEKLYSSTIDVILEKVLVSDSLKKLTRQEIDDAVNRIMQF